MLLRTKGKPINIENQLVGKVTRNPERLDENSFLLIDSSISELPSKNFMGVLSRQDEYEVKNAENVVFKIPTLDHLTDGDIVSVGNDGNINTLYRVNSFHNTLLATERCNSNWIPLCVHSPHETKMIFQFIIKFTKSYSVNSKRLF